MADSTDWDPPKKGGKQKSFCLLTVLSQKVTILMMRIEVNVKKNRDYLRKG